MTTRAPLFSWRDLSLALSLLTRLPVRVPPEYATTRGARAAWAYPLAGAVAALLAGCVGWLMLTSGTPASVAAGGALAAQVVITGAMHEDGLADAADGLWGGWDRARRLEIMKDSRIGSYGVLALILAIGLRWAALTVLAPVLLPAMLTAALLSRAVMIVVMGTLPNARDGGLSRRLGRPGRAVMVAGFALALLLAAMLVGAAALGLLTATIAAAAAAAVIARRKIGGQTGDILGATQQMAEIACLVAATALLV
ncbi:adenosylcobinamide-GDP ribazoletransferase [Tropicimonas sp.]|uniref:adenosylcobinamide-GDP ribazoletransferase n=1 Tax=Tropicimonas sp. TaxID=2067044 RepID=UPI003A8AAF1C